MANNYNTSIAQENRIMELERVVQDCLEAMYDMDAVDPELLERMEKIINYDTDDLYEEIEDLEG
jgi:tetrahydromethanopterin S-methyltransferase subunit B